MIRLKLERELPGMKTAIQLTPLMIGLLFIVAAWGCVGTPTVEPPVVSQPPGHPEPSAAPASQEAATQATIQINGMACPFCTYNIQRQIEALEGVQRVDVSLEKGEAYVSLSKQNPPTAKQLREAVESAGFTPGQVRMP